MTAVQWLEEQGAATLADCRARDDDALCSTMERLVETFAPRPIGEDRILCLSYSLKWLARRLTAAELRAVTAYCVWIYVRRESMLALILAGRRRKIRLPPELWQLIDETYPEGIMPSEYQ
jgi:hypothetical protein